MSNLTLNHTIPFGKYRGEKVSTILLKDAQYLEWLFDNTKLNADYQVIELLSNPIKYGKFVAEYEEQEEEDAFEIYLDNHPNPFNLPRYELKIAVRCSYAITAKKGNPSVDDWDKEIKYSKEDHLNITQPNRNLYGSA